MAKEVTITTYLSPEEHKEFMQKLGKMDIRMAASIKKVTRALMIIWTKGEIELTEEEILKITPDKRTWERIFIPPEEYKNES